MRNILPCNSPNCGGYTLEAELGITPNGYSAPDYRGWEVKTFGVRNFSRMNAEVITLMTPEPDGGLYEQLGVEKFIRRFGYPDVAGRADRINFGGVYSFNKIGTRTGVRLGLIGFDEAKNKIADVEGGIALFLKTECIALWSFEKLIDHWKRKHDKAVYVPNKTELGPPRRYYYGDQILLGRGAEFERLMSAIVTGAVYYDPGIKLEQASGKSKIKRRSQFRVKARDLRTLYGSFETYMVG
jgi:hypothetical protein